MQRVLNPRLWERYTDTRVHTARDNSDGGANEQWVKHGTRTTDPAAIYGGDFGIDYRYCEGGMFGRAAYFSVATAYSHHGYRYRLPGQPGKAQVFVARIAAGRVENRAPDGGLRMPSRGFHSIRGDVNSGYGLAYMLYEHHRSYPAYLVTYTFE